MAKFILVVETLDSEPTLLDEFTSVQDALTIVGSSVSSLGLRSDLTEDTEHNIRDANGNTRGYWMAASGKDAHAILSMVKSVLS